MESIKKDLIKQLLFISASVVLGWNSFTTQPDVCSWQSPYSCSRYIHATSMKDNLERLAALGERALIEGISSSIIDNFDLFREKNEKSEIL